VSATLVFKIARREFLARVRNRAFIAMTVLVPAFLGIYMFAMPMLTRSRSNDIRVAILDAGTGLGAPLAERLRAIERPRTQGAEQGSYAGVLDPGPHGRHRPPVATRRRGHGVPSLAASRADR
jgi:ABC-type Na+ efflux pump permease subunit